MTEPMRVTVADHALGNGYAAGLVRGLRANGVQARLAGPAASREDRVTAIYPRSASGRRIAKMWDGFSALPRYRRLVRSRPDIIHFQWPDPIDRFYAFIAKRAYGIPVAYTVHNFARETDPRHYQEAQHRFIRFADLVLVHGPVQREALLSVHPEARAKTATVEVGNYDEVITRFPQDVARQELGLPLETPVYVFVGQIRPRKGVDLLIEAFRDHREAGGTGVLLIVGNATVPAYADEVRRLADCCGDSVRWLAGTEPRSQRDLDLALSAATQVVLPFQAASQSASLVLAMTHGRCVVSTAAGEIPRTLAGRGIVVPPIDRDAIRAAMRLGQDDPHRCEQLGALAREYALDTLSWVKIAKKTTESYARAIQDTGASGRFGIVAP